jgi:hypothetical protein
MKKTKSQKSQKRVALRDLKARKEIKGGSTRPIGSTNNDN